VLGQRASMIDASGTTTYTYNNRNRLTSKASPEGTLNYTYDTAGNLLSTISSNANGVNTTYTYDTLYRLATVSDNASGIRPGTGTTTYNYDAAGNLAGYLYPNGVQTTYTHDSLNRLTNMSVIGSQNSALASYGYTLGAAGNRLSVTEHNGRSVNYLYDDLYRLTNEKVANDPNISSNGSIAYIYDQVGNRLSRASTVMIVPNQTSIYDANDRLVSDTYDNSGSTTSSNGNNYGYDFENQLTRLNNGVVTNVYDGDGNRVAETVGGITTKYVVDTNSLTGYAQVAEEIQNGSVARVYSYGLERVSETQSINGTLTTSFYGYDGHGSVRQLFDSTGMITDSYDYDAFGNLIASTGNTSNNYLFAGEQFDPALGMYFLRARYYNSNSGKFFSADSFEGDPESPLSLHRYLYADVDPVNRIDPTGNFTVSEFLTVVGIITTIIDAIGFIIHPTLANAVWLAIDVILLPEAVIKAVVSVVAAVRVVEILKGILSATEAAKDLIEVRAFWNARGFLKIARGETFLKAIGATGKVADAIIENPATRNVILEEAKTTLQEKTIGESILKFENTVSVIKNTGHGVEELYISASRIRYLGQYVVRDGYLFFKNGGQVLVDGLPIAVRIVGSE